MTGPRQKDPSARRRSNPTPGFRQLPAEGRTGDPPAWPLSAATDDELELWEKYWRLPQAIVWEELRCEDLVAHYVRTFVWATDPGMGNSASLKFSAEVRQLGDQLGFSPTSMQKLRWEVVPTAVEEPETETARRIITEIGP